MNKQCPKCASLRNNSPDLSEDRLLNQIESAWCIIANAMDSATNETWLKAARRWRDQYHTILDDYLKQNQGSPSNATLPRYHCNHCNLDFDQRASAPYGELGCPQCYSDNLTDRQISSTMQSSYSYRYFGEQLVAKGIITEQQLNEALERQRTTMTNRKLGEILVRLGYISKSHVTEGLAEQLGIPIINLAEREIPPRIRAMLDGSIATLYRVVPVEECNGVLTVATSDPTNINTLDNLSRLLDRQIEPVLSTPEHITEALARYYG